MKITFRILALGLSLAASAAAQTKTAAQSTPAAAHNPIMISSGSERWGDLPAAAIKGAPSVAMGGTLKLAVMEGDPMLAGKPYTVRLSCTNGLKIAPHWHPTDENVTVVKGNFAIGMGSKWDDAALKDLGTGGFAVAPARMNHFALCKSDAVLQVHGIGPLVINFVSAGAPAKTTTSKK